MRAETCLRAALQSALSEIGLDWPEKAVIETPRDTKHGDLASNIAMVACRSAKMSPRDLATRLIERVRALEPSIGSAEVAGPGFINFTFVPDFWREVVSIVAQKAEHYGSSESGRGKKIQVEYVSANPTGPLHIGHGRGAAVGDSLLRILAFTGWETQAEYYINDAGRQMRLLGLSVWLRAKEICNLPVEWPEEYYRGAYIADIAREMLQADPDLIKLPEAEGREKCYAYGMKVISDGIKADLKKFRVHHDQWFSEKTLVDNGAVDAAFAYLQEKGLLFEHEGALWFRTTNLGDDKDRVLRTSEGRLTYFATDIAYHHDKYRRGFDKLVDVWGADHHGYIPRMRAAIAAMGKPADSFDVVLIQLVNLIKDGTPVAMSTRAGKFETLADVVNEVGVDATRFMFLSRKSDSPLDFDLDLVRSRSMDNPVYYVQYAHARICAVLRKAQEAGLVADNIQNNLAALTDSEELAILRQLDHFPDVVENAARELMPHYISFYLMELARSLHSYYANHPVMQASDKNVAEARLALLKAIAQVLKNGLDLIGVEAPDAM